MSETSENFKESCRNVSHYFVKVNHHSEDTSEIDTSNKNIAEEGKSKKPKLDNSKLVQEKMSFSSSSLRFDEKFYNQSCLSLARRLLGQTLVHVVNGVRLSGIIVETECYLGGVDVASHSYNGKRTPRNEPMYMKPGTAYVYPIYGMYFCFNVSSEGEGACVLIRALEPLDGIDMMHNNRSAKRKNVTPLKLHQLCSGPSRLCQALAITKETCNKLDLSISTEFWIEKRNSFAAEDNDDKIIVSKRIGIQSAGPEWANKPLRFYIYSSLHVSIRDKHAEIGTET